MTDSLSLPQFLLAAAVGISLAAAVGFRVFVPMLLVGLASRSGQLPLAEGFQWLGSDLALIMLGIAAIVEISAYFIPFLDHFLDAITTPVVLGAGTLLMASTLVDMAPWLRWAIALVAGGGTAGLIHGTGAGLRAGSTATTGGLANPVFASLELGGATLLTILAIALPLVALAVVLFLMARALRLVGWGFRKLRSE